MNNESSSLCNLNLEDSDLKKLEELDPFQTDGYQSLGKINLPVTIVYTDEKGKQTADKQILTLQLLIRSFKAAPTKGKEPKAEPQLDSMRIYLFSQEDIFLNMVSTMSNSTFQAVKTKNELNLKFKDLPSSVLGMLKNCTENGGEGKNQAELRLSFEGTGKMVISQQTEYKAIELLQLYFTGSSIQRAHQSIIYRYNFNRTKLSMIQNSIDSIYKLLAVKNAPLLAYIQKSVGDSF